MSRVELALLLALAACNSGSVPPAATAPPAGSAAAVTTAKGTVVTRTFHSEALGVDKDYVVYLPAGYDASPTKRYPVLYYLHGLGGNERSWIKGGHLDEVADQLGLQAIVVMPDGDASFYADAVKDPDFDACLRDGTGIYIPRLEPRDKACVRHRKYETYIVADVVHDVDATYRTVAAPGARGIAGFSMGGYGALVLAMRHPDIFSAAASHSGVDSLVYEGPHPYATGHATLTDHFETWGRSAETILPNLSGWMQEIFGTDPAVWKAHDPTTLAATLEPGKLALYLDCGSEDELALEDGAAYLHDLLLARHVEHAFFIGPGHHDFGFWKARVAESLKFLRDHTRS